MIGVVLVILLLCFTTGCSSSSRSTSAAVSDPSLKTVTTTQAVTTVATTATTKATTVSTTIRTTATTMQPTSTYCASCGVPTDRSTAPKTTTERSLSSGSSSAPCSCSADTVNCKDSGAKACYDYCISQGKGDVHKLDADKDGIPCE